MNKKEYLTPVPRNEQGFPLLPDGSVDIERHKCEIDYEQSRYEDDLGQKRKLRNKNTHLMPKKKKRKK